MLIRTFPGAKVADMKHYIQPTLSTSPEILLLHVGTNDLSHSTSQNVLEELTTLGQAISVDREVSVDRKLSEINTQLSQVCATDN